MGHVAQSGDHVFKSHVIRQLSGDHGCSSWIMAARQNLSDIGFMVMVYDYYTSAW